MSYSHLKNGKVGAMRLRRYLVVAILVITGSWTGFLEQQIQACFLGSNPINSFTSRKR